LPFLPTRYYPFWFKFSQKFRVISQIREQGEGKNLEINTPRMFTWVFTQVNTQKVFTQIPGYLPEKFDRNLKLVNTHGIYRLVFN